MNNTDRGFAYTDSFINRHLGPDEQETQEMLKEIGVSSLRELVNAIIPASILLKKPLQLEPAQSEHEMIAGLRKIAAQNQIFRSFIGMGYSDTIVPPVIQRNILENPGWYTQYTPYQAEIAQGRLEALLNFQTLVKDLTALEITNASLLDEGTAAAEAMTMAWHLKNKPASAFFVSAHCHPQTIEVLKTRAKPLGIKIHVADPAQFDFKSAVFGVLVQYPATDGAIYDYRALAEQAHQADALVIAAADILALTLLTPPGEWGADIAVGSTQRLGVPMGFGGPHAAYFATRDAFKRNLPGRIVGVSKDVDGKPAIRLALQTREQHIRRDKATSNICTAQVLLAVMASMYAVYHGAEGLRKIAGRIRLMALTLAKGLESLGYALGSEPFFDTVRINLNSTQKLDVILAQAESLRINLRILDPKTITVSLDEVTSLKDLEDLLAIFAKGAGKSLSAPVESFKPKSTDFSVEFSRKSKFLTHPVFNTHRSETQMLRYIFKLQSRDLSLAFSMIPLGSCTMKLNATSEMLPVTWPEFGKLHPFVPATQSQGYKVMLTQLEKWLTEITGFAAVSLQPNAGSQGEYTGLLVIRQYQESIGQGHRDICLIPQSAHGTNPASAVMAGMKVVVVQTDAMGNVDLADLREKAQAHKADLAAIMITYPSTHGVFEEGITEICEIVHQNGGQVYMDGANMNAQIALCRPGDFGPDVCHLNLHKTFCIPHGGGGPGMGPIGVQAHLAPFLPTHPFGKTGGAQGSGPVASAPWGSASILPISWAYIAMMGPEGLERATQVAMLNANYIAKKLSTHYPVLYKGKQGLIAHECIFDFRPLKASAGIEVEDVAKRLMDYGFHAPTVSFPVAGTIMVEPTESESKEELDRFCEAMILIREEIREIEQGKADRENNVLKNAPHTAEQIAKTEWNRPYPREMAAYPAKWTRENKFWPAVGRINNVLGDRNLICSCPPIEDYAD